MSKSLPKPSREIALKRLKEIEVKERAILERMVSYKGSNLIEFFNKPNPLQEKLLKAWVDDQYKVFTFTGGNRTGKTTIGVILAISTILGYFPWNKETLLFPHKNPRKVRYIGQDWEKQIKAVVVPELEKWWPSKEKVEKRKNNNGVDAYWTHVESGSTIEIMSNGQESALHEGWQGDLVIYEEPPRRNIRVANARGLVDRRGKELFCMTLLSEAWVDREVIRGVDSRGKPDPTIFNVHGTIYDNIGFGITKEGVAQFEKTLTDEERDARLLGIPAYMSGLVYPQYDRKVHLVERFPVPIDWMVDVGIDIHPREKQAILFCAVSPSGKKYLVNEIWSHGDGKWVGQEVVRCARLYGYRINRVIIDPLAKGDSNNPNTVFDKVQIELLKHGHWLETGAKDKVSGILLVRNHLLGPNKEPSLFIFDDLIRTIYEIEGYMYDKDTQKPIKKDDHMMENLYRIMLLDTVWEDIIEEDEEYTIQPSSIGGY